MITSETGRVDSLLTVKQLPGIPIRSADDALAAVETNDTALTGDLTYKKGADRITLKQRVEQVPHPDLIPPNISLDKAQMPGIGIMATPTPHEVQNRKG